MVRSTVCLGILLSAASASADWLVFADGQRTEVRAVEITERAVHVTTLAGKPWSVLRDAVDVDATRAANQVALPLEIVTVEDDPPIAPAPPEPPPAPPRPPPAPERTPAPPTTVEPVVEREPTPPPRADILVVDEMPSHAYRFAITVNGLRATDALSFTESNQFELFKEPARVDSVYSDPRPQGYEVGAHYRFAGPFAVGATVQRFDGDREARYTASLPHPFFFDRFRELSGRASGLTHEELAVHVDAAVTTTWGPLTIDAFGGPSWFQTRTEILVDVVYDEVFPYDEVFFQGVEGRVLESRPIGFNVGGRATLRIGGIFGVDFGVRYSEARSTLFVEDGRAIDLDAGGLNVSAGLRFLFP